MGSRALLLAIAVVAGCGREETPTPAPPAPASAPRRGPAGEVPPDSRRVTDEGAPGYSYSFPGVPESGTHYHLLVPDAGDPSAALAGGTTDRGLALRILRAENVVDAAIAVKAALKDAGAEIVDPATSGGCGDVDGHARPGAALRKPPLVRVVRARIAPADLPRWDAALERIPGTRRLLAAALGGDGKWKGEVVLDVHLVP